jgi:5'-nucleotidase
MRALVTNDDGVDSVGLLTLARIAVEAGLDVVVAAPNSEYSGSSASLTAFESGGHLVLRDVALDGLDAHRCVAVDATPAFITMAAATGAFGPPPDLVLSGINLGPNTGQAILHSGTVGAALTASTHGCAGVAFSLAGAQPTEFETGAAVAQRVLSWLVASGPLPGVVLNVNIPDVPLADLRGIQAAGLAAFGAVQGNVANTGRGFVTMTYEKVRHADEPGTDAALVRSDWATVTPLLALCQAGEIDLGGLVGPRGSGGPTPELASW